jgi:hypothetical protein
MRANELDPKSCDAIMRGVQASLERTLAMNDGDEIEYVELSERTDFNDRFVEQLAFPVGK